MKRNFLPIFIVVFILGFSTINLSAQTTPKITGVNPPDQATDVFLDTDIFLNVIDMNPDPEENGTAGVDGATLTSDNVYVYKTSDGPTVKVPAFYNTSVGGDIIVISPMQAFFEVNTHYTVVVTSGVTDTTDVSFEPFTSTFTTGTTAENNPAPVSFSQSPNIFPDGQQIPGKYTSLAIGPDNRLYTTVGVGPEEVAGEGPVFGKIRIFDIRPNGHLIPRHTITALQGNFMTGRFPIGLTFDPASTPDNPILWVTSNATNFGEAPNFSSSVHRLTVTNHNTLYEMWTQQTFITGLPRSIKEHMSNSLAFGPDGALYLTQGSLTGMGAPDPGWGRQPDTVLSAAVLRIDVAELQRRAALPDGDPQKIVLPLNVATGVAVNGKLNDPLTGQLLPGAVNYGLGDPASPLYNPLAPDAIVTLYATGIRNAYDLLWHSNGQLYIATNGGASGDNTPTSPDDPSTLPQCQNRIDKGMYGDYTGPKVTGGENWGDQRDYLYRITQGGYYGHPNVTRCEWVLNGGNSDASRADTRVHEYLPGTAPDRNYRMDDVFSLGYHKGPDGTIEYKSDAFNGALKGKILIIRYSENNDMLVITPDGPEHNFNISQVPMTIGAGDWYNPLDLVEDVRNGNIYISEYFSDRNPNEGRLRLLQADTPPAVVGDPNIALMQNSLTFHDYIGGGMTPAQRVEIRNHGTSNLRITSLNISGASADQFHIVAKPFLPMVLAPNQATVVTVSFEITSSFDKTATLEIGSIDPDTPVATVLLNGIEVPAPTETPTITPIPPTMTMTPDPSTPTATPENSIDLLVNGGFELDIESPKKQPDNWNVVLPSKDKRVCNNVNIIHSFEGDCAYRFKGGVPEQVKVVQSPDISAHTFKAGDTLSLNFQYRTKAAQPRLKVKVVVVYKDISLGTSGRQVTPFVINTTSPGVYSPYQHPTITLQGDVDKIKVQFQNKATSSAIWVDDVKLKFTPLP